MNTNKKKGGSDLLSLRKKICIPFQITGYSNQKRNWHNIFI